MTKSGVIWPAVLVLSLCVALYSFRFIGAPFGIWLSVDPAIEQVFDQANLAMTAHTFFGPLALLAGPFQFWTALRARRPALHRWTGRVYVLSCTVAGVAGLAAALHASGGPVATIGFGTLAIAWLATTVAAWIAATRRDFDLHRQLMLYSFAMTFGAVTLRLQIPLGFILFHAQSYRAMSPVLSFTSWIPNVLIIWIYSLGFNRGRGLAASRAGTA
ncbi:MAG: DUF2306 domain-containing protein [Rhizomicrobium sp.]|jgi:uncharacterized membrane protein